MEYRLGVVHNESLVYICQKTGSDDDFKGYDNGSWVNLSVEEERTNVITRHFKKPNNDTYFSYVFVPTPPSGYSQWSTGWGKTYNRKVVYICKNGSSYMGYTNGVWEKLTQKIGGTNNGRNRDFLVTGRAGGINGAISKIDFYTPNNVIYFPTL